MCDFLEDKYLREQIESIEEIGQVYLLKYWKK